jgi:class 3 adenylate cyclase
MKVINDENARPLGPPRHRSILAVDIEGSTARTNTAKAGLRAAMYALLEESMVVSGIGELYRDPLVDRGDGILALIHPVDDVPKTLLLSMVIPTLGELLVEHAARNPDQHLRLRAVVHAGEVHYDGRGCFGEALDVAFRLLDAPEVKEVLRRSVGPLLLVASDQIYRSVIRHGYDGIDERAFVEVAHVEVAGQRHCGWVRVPQEANGHGGTVIDVHRKRSRRLVRGPWRTDPSERLA